MAIGKVAAHLCLTLIVKELKISVGQSRVVTTLNIIKHIIFNALMLTIEMILAISERDTLTL